MDQKRINVSTSGWLLWLQLAASVAVLGSIAMAPPASGRMMIVPLTLRAAAAAPRLALDAGANLVQTGPIAGSIVVDGRRASLIGAMIGNHMLLTAAPRAGCGAPEETEPA